MYADWLSEDIFRLRAWRRIINDDGEEEDDGEDDEDEEEEDESDDGSDDDGGGDEEPEDVDDGDSGDDSDDGGDYFDWADDDDDGGGDDTGDADRGFTAGRSPYGDDDDQDYVTDAYESRAYDDDDDDARDPRRPRSYFDRRYDDDGNEVDDDDDDDGALGVARRVAQEPYKPRTQAPSEGVPWWQREKDDRPAAPPMPPTRPPLHADSNEGTAAQTAMATAAPVATPQPQQSQGPIASMLDAAAKKMFQDELGREVALTQAGRATADDVPLLKQIMADWRKESGRRAPNEQDPRDMGNFWKYAEDWTGVAADRADKAEKLGVHPFRNAMFNAAGQQVEQERQQAARLAQQTQPRNPEAPRGVVGSIVPPMPPTSARTAAADFEDADSMRPPGYRPGGAVERPTGAIESPDAEAAPYIDASGQRQPAMAARLDGRAASDQPQVAGMFERAGGANQEQALALRESAAPPAQYGPFLNEVAPAPQRSVNYAPLVSQVATVAQERPLDAAASVLIAMQQKSPTVVPVGGDMQAPVHLGSAISELVRDPRAPAAQWAVPAVEAIASMAFAQEYNQSPAAMPKEYAVHWLESWKKGQAPLLAEQLDRQMREVGAWTPSSPMQMGWKEKYGRDLVAVDQSRLITDANYRNTMDKPVSLAEAQAACGPIIAQALTRIASQDGKPVTYGEAMEAGALSGWTAGGGMNGIQNQSKLLTRVGVQHEVGAFDALKASREVSEERPVIISTNGHYFLSTDYNSETGKHYVGATGRAYTGGSEWMSPADMERISGKINGAIYYRGPGNVQAPAQAASQAPAQQPNSVAVGALPPQLADANPREGLVSGVDRPSDQLARLYQRALAETQDQDYAEGMAALALGEGGMGGEVGDKGQSHGMFQFYWGGGEGNAFQKWLGQQRGRQVSEKEAREAAKNVDTALDYYVSRAYGFYQAGKKKGLTNPTLAIVGGGHNSGAIGRSEQKIYEDAWRRWKSGQFSGGKTIAGVSR